MGPNRPARAFVVGCAGLCLLIAPRIARSALGELTGGGRPARGSTGGAVSSNPHIHHQQMVADPEGAEFGSTTVTYDPNDVSLQSVYGLNGTPRYGVTGGYVGVQISSVTAVQTLADFFAHPAGPETGYVQVQWDSRVGGSTFGLTPDSPAGYEPNGRFGSANPSTGGDDTHGLQFAYLAAPTVSATYEVEEDAQTFPIYDSSKGFLGTNNSPDSYTATDAAGDVYTFDASDTDPAFDTVDDEPEPASAGLLALAAPALLVRRRSPRPVRKGHGRR